MTINWASCAASRTPSADAGRVLSAEHCAAWRFAAGQTGQQVNAYERTASLVYRELGAGLRMWVWVLGAMIVALFVGFAWVTK